MSILRLSTGRHGVTTRFFLATSVRLWFLAYVIGKSHKNPATTATGLYNVLKKVGAGGTAELTAKERNAYDKGLVALNAERRAEEAHGNVHWLRPAFQNPQGTESGGEQQAVMKNVQPDEAAPVQAQPPKQWPPPHCRNPILPFKSTPPLAAGNPLLHMVFNDSTPNLTGQQ